MKVKAIAFSTQGCRTLQRLEGYFDDIELYSKTRADSLGIPSVDNVDDWVREAFTTCDALIFVGALGICVRHIAPYLKSKDKDPAVIDIDEIVRFTIPVSSGHIGGGNELALKIADYLESTPVITTATDLHGLFAVDVFATKNHLSIQRLYLAKEASSRILHDEYIGFVSRNGYDGKLPKGLTESSEGEFGICISSDPDDKPFGSTLLLVPQDISVGIGCRKDTDPKKLSDFVKETLWKEGIYKLRVGSISSIDIKSNEKAIHELGYEYNIKPHFYTADELMSLEGEFSKSEFVKSVTSVDCVCERSAAYTGGKIILKKTARDGMTIALAKKEIKPRFD